MNWRASGALFRREVRRGRRSIGIYTALMLTGIGLALLLRPEVASMAGALCIIIGIFAVFSPIGDLRADKMQGHLEFDRVLPVGHAVAATARLLGAAVRTLPVLLAPVPLLIGLHRSSETDNPPSLVLMMIVAGGSWLVLTACMWALMAINIRWNLRRLWWLPMTIAFGPRVVISLLPPPATDAMALWFAGAGRAIATFVQSPLGAIVMTLVVLAIPVGLFVAAIGLFASGLDRYTYDASAAVPLRAKPPKRELGAIGRGPVLAVARYCIRLATEQSWRRIMLLAVFVAVLVFGSPVLKDYARFYVRALAAMLPGGIVIQLTTARARGHLEGLQQLPHPPLVVGVGHLLAVCVLAIPGAAVWILARAVTGMAPTAGNAVTLLAWMVMWSWLASVAAVWLTARRAILVGAIPVVLAGAWIAYLGAHRFIASVTAAATRYHDFRGDAGAALPVAFSGLLIVVGMPLFARGLAEYQHGERQRTASWARVFRRRV